MESATIIGVQGSTAPAAASMQSVREATAPIISVEGLTKRYKKAETNALDGVSFSVRQGEFFTLLGPNGAGKTTAISILTTTLAPTSGTVTIAGHDVIRESSAVRRSVGIIFQKPSLDMNLSGEENVRFHAILYGLYPFRPAYWLMPAAYKAQVRELSSVLGIDREIFKPVRSYSGGMKRKLEIIRSLIHRPKVLFLDEPTTGLDVASRRNLWEYLGKVRRESGTTIFLTTHYLEEAEQADSICIINRGKVVLNGTPDEVKANLVEEYVLIDAADRNRLRAELRQLEIAFNETPLFKVRLEGESVHSLLKQIETPLTMVQTHTPSLEDAYLKIVEEKEEE
ncbi:MAG TPA: ABC transporter ATP-binding protein [Chloroflexia bacterium]|nr:ABC transporter ATP-binding protein [Chloroflexia bacterium]